MTFERKDYKQIVEELHSQLNEGELEVASSLYALHRIISGAIPSKNYIPVNEWGSVIKPTDYGLEVVKGIDPSSSLYSEGEIAFALFLGFYHNKTLIDIRASIPIEISNILGIELVTKNLRLAERFGRTLYDRFNDNFEHGRPEFLDADDVDFLLEETDQGVYQIGRFVTGPLGVLQSRENRFLPPTRNLSLWHCADTGCGELHSVKLRRHPTRSYGLAQKIKNSLIRSQGPESDWEGPFARLATRNNYWQGREYYDLPVLIAECMPGIDREVLVSEALRGSTGSMLRAALLQARKDAAQGSPEKIAKNLSPSAQLQLLLSLTDAEIIRLVDASVCKKLIKIPPTETRRSRSSPPKLSTFDKSSTLCMFGIRSERTYPALFLSETIWKEYEGAAQLEDLAWRCHKNVGNSSAGPGTSIEYLNNYGPREAIKNLILPSRPIALAIAEKLHIILDPQEPEEQLIERMLWKFGFSPPRFEAKYARLQQQLEQLRDEALKHRSSLTEDDRDALRSSGVNVFVSLENIIEEIVSYNVWLLSSDHFIDTAFQYASTKAVARVPQVLGKAIQIGENNFVWSSSGGNVLGVLLVYTRAAADWMKGLTVKIRDDVERRIEEMPHFAGADNQHFPFRHRELWADASLVQLREFSEKFDGLVGDLERSKLAEVRNGLDHYRNEERFPSVDTIISCESRLSVALKAADINRFIPKSFWMVAMKKDSFGLVEYELSDYAGRRVTIQGPRPLSALRDPLFSYSALIPFGNLLGMPASNIVFSIREESAYTKFWDHYPRRPESNNILTEETGNPQEISDNGSI